jgi:uncharacterized damage-inducible protein DinB
MISQLPWTQRTFNFDFHPGLFPNIMERLSGTSARISELIYGLSDEKLSENISKKWSIKEHIGHLHDLEDLHYSRLDDFLNHAPVLRAADMTNKKTNEANHNSRAIGELIEQFKMSRKTFTDRLSTLNEYQIIITSMHPRLNQPMRLVDMMLFTAEHDDHHLAIIRNLRKF